MLVKDKIKNDNYNCPGLPPPGCPEVGSVGPTGRVFCDPGLVRGSLGGAIVPGGADSAFFLVMRPSAQTIKEPKISSSITILFVYQF